MAMTAPESDLLGPRHGSWGQTPRPKTQPPRQARDPRPSVPSRPKTQDPARNGQKFRRVIGNAENVSVVTEKSVSLPQTNIAVRLRCVPECRKNKVRLVTRKKMQISLAALRVEFFRFLVVSDPKVPGSGCPKTQDPRPSPLAGSKTQDPVAPGGPRPKTQDPCLGPNLTYVST